MTGHKPTPDEVRAFRMARGMSARALAALIHKTGRRWYEYEAPEGSSDHRSMSAACWELVNLKAPPALNDAA